MTTQNPKIRAIVEIRNLVLGLSTDWQELKSKGAETDALIEEANSIFLNNTPITSHELWLKEIMIVRQNVLALREVMKQTVDKINKKDSNGISKIWNQHESYSNDLVDRFNVLNEIGKLHLPKGHQAKWDKMWIKIFDKFIAIQELAKGSSLHLLMIEGCTPDEVDELTDTILRHMPKKYTMEEAIQYETEYMEAYEELKKEASQKKNLWDRLLDILAGGIQQSPAERVMMQRWINGEKGEL